MTTWQPDDWTDEPVCPHCGAQQGDYWELNLRHDGDSTVVICDECGHEIKVWLCVSTSYSTEPWSKEHTALEKARRDLAMTRMHRDFVSRDLSEMTNQESPKYSVARNRLQQLERDVAAAEDEVRRLEAVVAGKNG